MREVIEILSGYEPITTPLRKLTTDEKLEPQRLEIIQKYVVTCAEPGSVYPDYEQHTNFVIRLLEYAKKSIGMQSLDSSQKVFEATMASVRWANIAFRVWLYHSEAHSNFLFEAKKASPSLCVKLHDDIGMATDDFTKEYSSQVLQAIRELRDVWRTSREKFSQLRTVVGGAIEALVSRGLSVYRNFFEVPLFTQVMSPTWFEYPAQSVEDDLSSLLQEEKFFAGSVLHQTSVGAYLSAVVTTHPDVSRIMLSHAEALLQGDSYDFEALSQFAASGGVKMNGLMDMFFDKIAAQVKRQIGLAHHGKIDSAFLEKLEELSKFAQSFFDGSSQRDLNKIVFEAARGAVLATPNAAKQIMALCDTAVKAGSVDHLERVLHAASGQISVDLLKEEAERALLSRILGGTSSQRKETELKLLKLLAKHFRRAPWKRIETLLRERDDNDALNEEVLPRIFSSKCSPPAPNVALQAFSSHGIGRIMDCTISRLAPSLNTFAHTLQSVYAESHPRRKLLWVPFASSVTVWWRHSAGRSQLMMTAMHFGILEYLDDCERGLDSDRKRWGCPCDGVSPITAISDALDCNVGFVRRCIDDLVAARVVRLVPPSGTLRIEHSHDEEYVRVTAAGYAPKRKSELRRIEQHRRDIVDSAIIRALKREGRTLHDPIRIQSLVHKEVRLRLEAPVTADEIESSIRRLCARGYLRIEGAMLAYIP